MKSLRFTFSLRLVSFVACAAIAALVVSSSRHGSADAEELGSASGLAQLFAATGVAIPRPDLSACPLVARKFALSTYMKEMSADAAKIQAALDNASKLYDICRPLSGSYKASCCEQIKNSSTQKCQDRIAAEEAADSNCAPRPIDCRTLRPAKCLLERAIERQRVKCCTSLDQQGFNFLSNYCAISEASLAQACLVPAVDTPAVGQ